MTETPNLALPLIAAAQSQKHVTHNEALFALDTLLQCAVRDRDRASPPGSPQEGDRYIVAASPTGVWSGHAGEIACQDGGGWRFVVPKVGFVAYVVDEAILCLHDGGGWSPVASSLGALQNLTRLGIGTNADGANPFAAKLNAALWTARGSGEGGSGDLRYTLNKESAANVLSLLFETGYSGRLEFGLIGSDAPSLKVSQDGATWRQALSIDPATGGLDWLASEATLAAAATCDLGSVPHLKVAVAGTTRIASFGTRPHCWRFVRFANALTLAHDPTALILPGAADIATAPGDALIAMSDAAGRWRVVQYGRASGQSLVPSFAPQVDNVTPLGGPTARFSTIYAATGTINTSDARDKTATEAFSEAETAAARRLAAEIGCFRYRDRLAAKGDGQARRHIGLTVQRAIAILREEGLDPLSYAFICHDRAPGPGARDRYGFRSDQLALFVARGLEARLATLEATLTG